MRVIYECEYCKEIYNDKESCEACEKSHSRKGEIVNEEFFHKEAIVPNRLTVKYGTKIVKYTYDYIVEG